SRLSCRIGVCLSRICQWQDEDEPTFGIGTGSESGRRNRIGKCRRATLSGRKAGQEGGFCQGEDYQYCSVGAKTERSELTKGKSFATTLYSLFLEKLTMPPDLS